MLKEQSKLYIPGNFFGFLNGTNFAPIANAMGGPKIKPLASIPAKHGGKKKSFSILSTI
jgi:hypothetical protein